MQNNFEGYAPVGVSHGEGMPTVSDTIKKQIEEMKEGGDFGKSITETFTENELMLIDEGILNSFGGNLKGLAFIEEENDQSRVTELLKEYLAFGKNRDHGGPIDGRIKEIQKEVGKIYGE